MCFFLNSDLMHIYTVAKHQSQQMILSACFQCLFCLAKCYLTAMQTDYC
uniref:Uncharacterized protein n=1 Tax=Anguilla anguilla TaxID=7936 RepID=A0A0E9W3P8_ANGAN